MSSAEVDKSITEPKTESQLWRQLATTPTRAEPWLDLARIYACAGDWLSWLYLARLYELVGAAASSLANLAQAQALEPLAGESLHWLGVGA